MLRRMAARHEDVEARAKTILGEYTSKGADFAQQGEEAARQKKAELKSKPRSKAVKGKVKARGPLGLLLLSLANAGATLAPPLDIKQDGEANISILEEPWQHLRDMVTDAGIRARDIRTAQMRKVMQGCEEIDHNILDAALAKLLPEDRGIMNCVTALGEWDEVHLHDIQELDDDRCELCGEEQGTWEHKIWRIQSLEGRKRRGGKTQGSCRQRRCLAQNA